ncbi:uncharacterized protein [Littorina saxatilis]|uniref:Galectin domain-containing protein n=1 Tax=Littorina saxatilis TaxID=31220 RepID=A0AAN9GC02_9CAEN
MVRSEGWHQDSWTMCMHGTLGPTETTFLLKLWRPDDDVAKVKAIYWQNNSTVVMEEWEGEQRVGEETVAPKPYPFATGQEFSITIHISNDTVTYNLCGSECFTMDRSLPDSDIHTLQLFMQASVDYLDLWCM